MKQPRSHTHRFNPSMAKWLVRALISGIGVLSLGLGVLYLGMAIEIAVKQLFDDACGDRRVARDL